MGVEAVKSKSKSLVTKKINPKNSANRSHNVTQIARLDPRLSERLAAKKTRLDNYRPLPASVVRRLNAELQIFLTYHSNAIEGNTLSLRETQLVIEEGLTVGGHSLREHLEATNHARAYTYLTQLVEKNAEISLQTVLDLHKLVMGGGLDDENAGRWRTGQVYIRGAGHTPPPAYQVEPMLGEWLAWHTGFQSKQYGPVVRDAISHHDFEYIQPFTDGDGRTGRLLLNLMLMREGYPPALLLKDWRIGYLHALDTATLSGNYSSLANLVGRAVEDGLDLYLEACHQEPGDLYQLLSDLAGPSGYSVDYLGWLIRQGRLEAVKRGGRWYTTVGNIQRYQQQVQQGLVPKGRPPQAGV